MNQLNGICLNRNFDQTTLSPRRIFKSTMPLVACLICVFAFAGVSVGQGIRGATTSTRGFQLYGDVNVDESKVDGPKPLAMDIILSTKGNQVVGRQRISPGGRYRFMDIFDGDYWLIIEFEGTEVVRESVFIAKTATFDVRHDVTLEWHSIGSRVARPGVVSTADLYNRSGANKSLYQKSAKEIEAKNYTQAITILKQIVSADPNDFPAWSDLGMLYFIQKDFEAAETSYASALTAKASYFPAALNIGRAQLAKKDYEKAIASFEAALKIDPKSAQANYFLGEAYLGIKKGSKAVVYLNEALTIDPVGMADAHLRLGALYNAAGMKDKAAAEYEQFLKKKPDYADRKKLEQYISDNKKP
jgi:Tfp pilus assembly protein PilF